MIQQPETRQVDTIQLAPDALVFINGSNTIKDANGDVYQIRNDITELNTSANVDSPPGTAGFTISLPDHSIRRDGSSNYKSLQIMSEIEIYFKGRFPKEKTDGTLLYPYYPAFWGVITSISENYSDGVQTIQVSCADMLRWWQITSFVINPAAISADTPAELQKSVNGEAAQKDAQTAQGDLQPVVQNGQSISAAGFLASKTIPQILADLANVSLINLAKPDVFKDLEGSSVGTSDKNKGATFEAISYHIMSYWKPRLQQIGRRLSIYGVMYAADPKDPSKETLQFDNTMLSYIFPYPLDANKPEATQSITRTNYEIAMELKEIVMWEFYQDVNGDIIFKPPFYNMNVRDNIVSVIDDLDILNWNFTASEAEVVTRMDVTGWLWQGGSSSTAANKGVAYDVNKAKKYGIRTQQREVKFLNSAELCLRYAQLELNRMNALVMKGSVTIIGRPELKLGYPVFITSRNAFYYVTGIDHSFSFGGSFTTSLSLTAERNLIKNAEGNPDKNQLYREIGKVEDETKTVKGSSEADKTDTNFLKNLIDPCMPKKKKTEDFIEQPKFVADNSDTVKAMDFSVWNKVNATPTGNDIQVTDDEGFELIPFFEYGKSLNWNKDAIIQTIDKRRQVAGVGDNALKAQTLNPVDFDLRVSPNNNMLVFDDEDLSMLNVYDKSTKTKAEKALDIPMEQEFRSL